jgi:peptide chain release factor 2
MVKDLRSGYETGNTGAVLDGDLDAFMQAELERLATGGELGGDTRSGDDAA